MHTPEPLTLGPRYLDFDSEVCDIRIGADIVGTLYGHGTDGREESASWTDEDEARAQRIVACVNGCQGIANPAAVDDLLEACRQVICAAERGILSVNNTAADDCRAAIAKATGTEIIRSPNP